MIIKFFSSGTGGGAAPVNYLIAEKVLAYDAARNLMRTPNGEPIFKTRDPLPEIVRGNSDQTRDLIDASPNTWTYTAGVISFADTDEPDEQTQQEAIDRFEELAFAGLEPDQYDCLWVRHSHEGNIELHFCTPRLELSQGKALNIAPPGHETAFAALRDHLNKEFDWADPLAPDRSREFKPVKESADRAEARETIIAAIHDQIDMGLIKDRQTMIGFLEETGFEITRRSAKSISIRDPEFSKPFKLEGVLTHENWTAERHAEIAAQYETDANAKRTNRLDGFSHEDLCDAFREHVERRAEYNQTRYGITGSAVARDCDSIYKREPEALQELDVDISDGGPCVGDHLGLLELRNDVENATAAAPELWAEPGSDWWGDLPDLKPGSDQTGHVQDFGAAGVVPQGYELDGGPYTAGKRIAELRRAVGTSLRNLSEGISSAREAIFGTDRPSLQRFEQLHDLTGAIATALREGLEHVGEHIGRLRRSQERFSEERTRTYSTRDALQQKLGLKERENSQGLEL